MVFWAIVAILPPIFYLIMGETLAGLFTNQFFAPIVVLFVSIYYLYVWLFAFTSFVDYYLDVWLVTSERIVNIEQQGLFARTVSEQDLHRVQDVTSEVKGFFPTTLDFGTVYIQTAGEKQRFVFKQIPQPYRVVRKITKLVEEHKRFKEILENNDDIIKTK